LRVPPVFSQTRLTGLRFGGSVCLFINAVPRPGVDPDQIPVDDIEADVRGDDQWARAVKELRKSSGGGPCGSSGRPRTSAPPQGVGRWVVVWMNRLPPAGAARDDQVRTCAKITVL
jgi:hypothetical protein